MGDLCTICCTTFGDGGCDRCVRERYGIADAPPTPTLTWTCGRCGCRVEVRAPDLAKPRDVIVEPDHSRFQPLWTPREVKRIYPAQELVRDIEAAHDCPGGAVARGGER